MLLISYTLHRERERKKRSFCYGFVKIQMVWIFFQQYSTNLHREGERNVTDIIYYLVVQIQMVWIFFRQCSTNLAILTHYCLYQNTEMPCEYMFISLKPVPMHCSRYEFKIVNRPFSINVILRNTIHDNTIPVKFMIRVMHSTSHAFL